MSDNSQMEKESNIQSLNNLKSICDTEKNDLQNMLDNCNNRENKLTSENSDLKVENIRLKNKPSKVNLKPSKTYYHEKYRFINRIFCINICYEGSRNF